MSKDTLSEQPTEANFGESFGMGDDSIQKAVEAANALQSENYTYYAYSDKPEARSGSVHSRQVDPRVLKAAMQVIKKSAYPYYLDVADYNTLYLRNHRPGEE